MLAGGRCGRGRAARAARQPDRRPGHPDRGRSRAVGAGRRPAGGAARRSYRGLGLSRLRREPAAGRAVQRRRAPRGRSPVRAEGVGAVPPLAFASHRGSSLLGPTRGGRFSQNRTLMVKLPGTESDLTQQNGLSLMSLTRRMAAGLPVAGVTALAALAFGAPAYATDGGSARAAQPAVTASPDSDGDDAGYGGGAPAAATTAPND